MSTFSVTQEHSQWNKFNFLIGKWEGEGSGQPGEGAGYFTFEFDLNKNVLIRKSHSEYPAVEDKPRTVHDDLMIVYLNSSGIPDRAIYFDNETHVINYSIAVPDDKQIVFTSDKIQNAPIFRLIYTKLEIDLLDVKFEMSQDGEKFMTYLEGKSKRAKDEGESMNVDDENDRVFPFN